MLIPLGILASSGGGAAGSFELISTTTLGSSQASVTLDVSAYTSTYKHLQIRAVSRLDNGGGVEAQGAIRFNSDNGSNYSAHWLAGFGSNPASSTAFTSQSFMQGIDFGLAGAGTGNYGATIIDILDAFSTSKYKTIRSFSGTAASSIFLVSGNWRSTSAITTITMQGPTNQSWNIVAGSRFSIYGIEG